MVTCNGLYNTTLKERVLKRSLKLNTLSKFITNTKTHIHDIISEIENFKTLNHLKSENTIITSSSKKILLCSISKHCQVLMFIIRKRYFLI